VAQIEADSERMPAISDDPMFVMSPAEIIDLARRHTCFPN
jgi:hypothetical protein